ncbi:MAG TPA: type II secretion system F family protein [Thermotogota bacterium]|nr:type II secretion system F family protein [Thermotogota bacterium]HRW91406.1 type II secretion system F family protein [Thermotogota bacterium]
MPNFSYKATDINGTRLNGVVTSTNEAAAVNSLINKGYVVLSLKEVKSHRMKPLFSLKLMDLMTFSRQLATMVEAGVNLANALEVLAEQEVFSPRFRKIVTNVLVNIESGMSFAEALQNEKAFDEIFINMVDAGETSGTLSETLDKVASFYESQKRLRDEIKSATTYPAFILVFAVVMVVVITFFILPKLVESFGTEPTGIMAVLMKANKFIGDNWIIVVLALVGLAIGTFFFLKTSAGKSTVSAIMGVIPAVKNIRRNSSLERYCRTLAVMMSTGVDIIKSLDLASKASGDIRFEKITETMTDSIKAGTSLEAAFDDAGPFPGIVVAMVGTGERTGKMDAVLEKVAIFFEEKVRTSVKQLVSLLEPAMIVFVGLFIAFIAYTMYSSIFQGQQNISGL